VTELRFDTPSQKNGYYAQRRREKLVLELTQRAYTAECILAAQNGMEPPRELVPGYGRCACCQRDLSPDLLEVDHVNGRAWLLRKLNRWARVARYWREFLAGVELRALCRHCNARLGGTRRYARRQR
jgi:hypothetical protein